MRMRLFLVRMMMMEIMMILVLTLSNFDAFLTQTHKANSLKLETLYDKLSFTLVPSSSSFFVHANPS